MAAQKCIRPSVVPFPPLPPAPLPFCLSGPYQLVSHCCRWRLLQSSSLGSVTLNDWSLLFVYRPPPHRFSLQCVHRVIRVADGAAAQLMPFHHYRDVFIPLVPQRWRETVCLTAPKRYRIDWPFSHVSPSASKSFPPTGSQLRQGRNIMHNTGTRRKQYKSRREKSLCAGSSREQAGG